MQVCPPVTSTILFSQIDNFAKLLRRGMQDSNRAFIPRFVTFLLWFFSPSLTLVGVSGCRLLPQAGLLKTVALFIHKTCCCWFAHKEFEAQISFLQWYFKLVVLCEKKNSFLYCVQITVFIYWSLFIFYLFIFLEPTEWVSRSVWFCLNHLLPPRSTTT